MVEITEGGTALMSAEEVIRERERREAVQRLADMQRHEETKRLWHAFSKGAPFAVTFLVLCLLGMIGFTALKIMANAWNATDWAW